MRPKSLALALLLAFSGLACTPYVMNSQWAPPGQPMGAAAWQSLGGGADAEMALKVMNDGNYFYLFLSTESERIKCQLLGAFQQSLNIWFATNERFRDARGIRISFHRLPGTGFPHSDAEEREYMRAATREVALVFPGRSDPKFLDEKSKDNDIEVSTEMTEGRLTYFLKIPLASSPAHDWALDLQPGQSLVFGLETSPIDLRIAQDELIREYEAGYLGWGWTGRSEGFGPRQGYGAAKGFGLGNYDAWGLDKSIYARQQVYRPLSWNSVPQRLSYETTLRLAAEP